MTHRKARLETFTPEIASDLLSVKGPQRNISQLQVNRMVADMRGRRWADCYRMIEIDSNGHLNDGQHRLSAVMISGISQKFYVVRGLEPTTLVTTDMGGKATSKADTARRSGLEIGSMNIAVASANQVIQLRTSPDSIWGSRTVPSSSLALIELKENESIYAEGASRMSAKAKFFGATQSSILTMFVSLEKQFGQGDLFITRMIVPMVSGANLGVDDPRLTLKNFLTTHDRKAVGIWKTQTSVMLWTKAWNLLVEGKTMKRFKEPLRKNLPMEEIQPMNEGGEL